MRGGGGRAGALVTHIDWSKVSLGCPYGLASVKRESLFGFTLYDRCTCRLSSTFTYLVTMCVASVIMVSRQQCVKCTNKCLYIYTYYIRYEARLKEYWDARARDKEPGFVDDVVAVVIFTYTGNAGPIAKRGKILLPDDISLSLSRERERDCINRYYTDQRNRRYVDTCVAVL